MRALAEGMRVNVLGRPAPAASGLVVEMLSAELSPRVTLEYLIVNQVTVIFHSFGDEWRGESNNYVVNYNVITNRIFVDYDCEDAGNLVEETCRLVSPKVYETKSGLRVLRLAGALGFVDVQRRPSCAQLQLSYGDESAFPFDRRHICLSIARSNSAWRKPSSAYTRRIVCPPSAPALILDPV
ncbi:uncharacterized protein CCOS01_16442 [Colletotrichum costaricense]|uniref:Uncharacterized protein n=1 Tax=Colletotrichum costaricense TaxID=1209916 RepID=A0AAJ0DSD7_9PEZI|nr:uncharacterized protein CCOS01_16442 [Colletotrichum costaricense]KAK1506583.1 hypothetical protein CCOS01_16442 [Colletotrichum costaricense]